MERKNTMLLTVIAVATLLVAVVGATFAYYSVTGTNTSTTNTVSTTTQKVGTVTLAEQDEQLYLNVTANQLAKSLAGHDYWAKTENENAAESQQTHTLASITVAGGETTTKYHCTFKLTVTTEIRAEPTPAQDLASAERPSLSLPALVNAGIIDQ